MIAKPFMFLSVLFLSTQANAVEVSKSEWMDRMSTGLPAYFCQSDQYFRQCFDVSAEKCEESMSSATRLCLKKFENEIPEVLVQPSAGTNWGTIVGRCVGETYDVVNVKKRKTDAICLDPSHWMK